jgi:hypothetical protein
VDCLKASKNYGALQILEPNPALELIPTPFKFKLSKNKKNYIRYSTVTRVFFKNTTLAANLTVLREVLDINEGKWEDISKKSPTVSAQEIISSAIDYWSNSKGLAEATVGLLYDNLDAQGYKMAGGKLPITNICSQLIIQNVSTYSISDILLTYPGVTRETSICCSSTDLPGLNILNITV